MRLHKVLCVASLALLSACSFMQKKEEPKPLVKMKTELTATSRCARD